MIFRRGKKKQADDEASEDAAVVTDDDATGADREAGEDTGADDPAEDTAGSAPGEPDYATLDAASWRDQGPWDVTEVDLDDTTDGPRIDLGAMVITGVPGAELRLQVAEDSQQIVSAMLVIETEVSGESTANGAAQRVTSALELGAYAAPRSGGFWPEMREEIAEAATAAGGSASFNEGPFGVELFRLFPVRTPEGEEGYQPSKMWVAEGPRWLLRGIVYGQAAIEDNDTSTAVADVLAAFRKVVVRRGDEAMAPGDLLPLTMPTNVVANEPS